MIPMHADCSRIMPTLGLLFVIGAHGGCAGDSPRQEAARADPPASMPAGFVLASPAFADGGEIPRRHTCDGLNVSPPLNWSGAPAGTVSFVLILDDPDPPAPMNPRMSWTHWLVYNLPADAGGLKEDVTSVVLPDGIREGRNDSMVRGYQGPCPPLTEHRYRYRLFALDTFLPELGIPGRARLERHMAGHVLARAELVGTYWRRTYGAR